MADSTLDQLVYVPGGTFLQQEVGWDGNPQQQFTHRISSFQIGKKPVTYRLWYEVRVWGEAHGYEFGNPGMEVSAGLSAEAIRDLWPDYPDIGAAPGSAGGTEPVTMISWRDVFVWLNAYSEFRGLTPVYYSDVDFKHPVRTSTKAPQPDLADPDFDVAEYIQRYIRLEHGQEDNPYVDWSADGFRLPTEGEWMYAASYIDGDISVPPQLPAGGYDTEGGHIVAAELAWYSDNAAGKTQPVGLKIPTAIGIHDMSGNVAEMVWDFSAAYPDTPQQDYRGPGHGINRIVKGGAWSSDLWSLSIGIRVGSSPLSMGPDGGFRVARNVATADEE
ncbi:formylglycine-generating enzyme family protein [Spirochaeta africana]|uniref:formylglycine-generating enzyme family protein n=1 Tax=Spirochaeta africana TaxID=46355 RepID=UPI00145C8972|nr:SUMF1/EgtB/PvdO family nonheme iron enzyme [Spirochaeta africana]